MLGTIVVWYQVSNATRELKEIADTKLIVKRVDNTDWCSIKSHNRFLHTDSASISDCVLSMIGMMQLKTWEWLGCKKEEHWEFHTIKQYPFYLHIDKMLRFAGKMSYGSEIIYGIKLFQPHQPAMMKYLKYAELALAHTPRQSKLGMQSLRLGETW